MDKKIQLGITTDATQAVAGIEKVEKAQEGLVDATIKAQSELKSARKVVSEVRQYETLGNALKVTQEQLVKNKESLATLSAKQKQHIKLTDAENVSLKTNQNTISALNQKRLEGVELTTVEQNKLIRSQSIVDKLTKKKNEHYKLTKKEQAELERLTKSVSNLNAKEKNQTRQLSALNDKLKSAGISTKDLAKAKDIANRRAEKSAQLLERENRLLARSNQLQQRKKEALASMPSASTAAVGITAAGVLAGRESMHNEASFVDVAKTLDFGDQGYRSEDAQKLRRELNNLAVEMAGVNDTDVMKIAAGGANGGIAKEDLAAYTRDTIMTATAWDMTADEAAQKGMALRNSLGYEQGEAGQKQFMRMANMINDVANQNGGVSGNDLLGVMSRTGALMTNSGFTEAQALGLSGSLLSKGASAEEAATAAKNISSALTAGFSATGSQKEIFNMLGTDAESVALGMQEDAMGTLLDVLEGIKELNKEDQSAAIKSLFGDEANPHIQKLLKDTERLTKIQNEAAKASSTSVKDEYTSIASTNLSGAERAADAFGNLATVVGDKLWPAFNAILDPIVDLTIATTDWVAEAGIAADVVLGLGAAVVAGVAAYKVYQGVKFATNIASIAKETLALKSQQSATDKATTAANRHAAAMERQARATRGARVGETGSTVRTRGEAKTRRSPSRRRRGRKRGLVGLGMSLFSGATDFISGAAPKGMSLSGRAKGNILKTGAGLLAGGAALPTFAADGLNQAAQITGTVGDTLEGLHVEKFAKVAGFLRPLTVGLDAVSVATNLAKGDTAAAVGSGGGLLGGLGGAAAGAAIGTAILPGIGTAIGAGIGGMLGDSAGESIASTIFNWFSKDDNETRVAQEPQPEEKSYAALRMERMEKNRKRNEEWNKGVSLNPTESWVSKASLPDKTEEIKTAQIQKVEQAQKPNITFSPVVQVTGAQAPEQTAALTMETVQQALAQFAREHGLDSENLTQDFEHSLVS
ncbi:phage tail tape measure protein [Vibrio parahaemolyticus]|uniref:phage tail tape measure protein n=1 Tax=Vibrio parahaemolyticus TaxID=670 RepID=UPI001EEF6635|nr:phage tail tape measure protein [Vibrio parahaemolyticus]UJX32988.1 phage tail tape measure protein [Vibrio parahaemolyticus]